MWRLIFFLIAAALLYEMYVYRKDIHDYTYKYFNEHPVEKKVNVSRTLRPLPKPKEAQVVEPKKVIEKQVQEEEQVDPHKGQVLVEVIDKLEKVLCPACKNTELTCPVCKGTGEVLYTTCPECGKKITVIKKGVSGMKVFRCFDCKRNVEDDPPCPRCDGAGKIECKNCNNTGWELRKKSHWEWVDKPR